VLVEKDFVKIGSLAFFLARTCSRSDLIATVLDFK